MLSLNELMHRYRRQLAPLRTLHYALWRATGVSGIEARRDDLKALSRIIHRTPSESLEARQHGRKVLIVTFREWQTHVMWDALLGHALRRRGGDVQFFTCGGRLPICDVGVSTVSPPLPCNRCAPYVSSVLSMLRFPYTEMRNYINGDEWAEIERQIAAVAPENYREFQFDGLPLGRLVLPSIQWFLLSADPPFDREMQETYRRFLISGAIMSRVAARMLQSVKPDVLYVISGIFFAESIMIEHARRLGISYVTHEGGFMPDTQVFAHNGIANFYELGGAWETYRNRALTVRENQLLDEYLLQRAGGGHDVAAYYPQMVAGENAVVEQIGLDRGKPIITLFTNVDWDTAAFASGRVFESMGHWIVHTIRFFARHPELQLVIRIHPAEMRLTFRETRNPVAAMIRRTFSELPANIHVIPPESGVSSYALMNLSRAGLVYSSTTGMEMALRGKPVIAAGHPYYGRRGFTHDAESIAEYDELLARAGGIEPLSEETVAIARRYASLFFFRNHIRFPLTTSDSEGIVKFNFETLAALEPGREPQIDLLCDAILHDAPFLYEGEL